MAWDITAQSPIHSQGKRRQAFPRQRAQCDPILPLQEAWRSQLRALTVHLSPNEGSPNPDRELSALRFEPLLISPP